MLEPRLCTYLLEDHQMMTSAYKKRYYTYEIKYIYEICNLADQEMEQERDKSLLAGSGYHI